VKRLFSVVLPLLLLAAGLASPARAQTASHRYVVFLAGLCPWTNSDAYCHGQIDAGTRARATFRTLIAAMSRAHLAYTPLYYSYDPAHNSYTVTQTHGSVSASTAALNAELQAVRSGDPAASFILIGHSLGGVIAARWAAGHAAGAESVITFDSPLRGIRAGSLLGSVFGGAVWKGLQPDSPTIRSITDRPASWWQATGHLHTVANTADVLVPPGEALLGARHTVTDSSCPVDLLVVRSCHGAVLSDTALNTWVVSHWLAPTVAPTPSPTAALPSPPAASPTAAP
jgi:pimeloyl-ACP methyl ester carboxylesterase